MLELHIKPMAGQSFVSQKPLQSGNWVVSFLYRTETGVLERADLLAVEAENWVVPGEVICRWERLLPEETTSEASRRRRMMSGAEELFLALCAENPADAEGTSEEKGPVVAKESNAALRYLLSLMLERKRLLQRLPGKTGACLHRTTGETVFAPEVQLSPAVLNKILGTLGNLIPDPARS